MQPDCLRRLLVAGSWVESSHLPAIGGRFLCSTLVPLGPGRRPFAPLNPSTGLEKTSHDAQKSFFFCPWAVWKIEKWNVSKGSSYQCRQFLLFVFTVVKSWMSMTLKCFQRSENAFNSPAPCLTMNTATSQERARFHMQEQRDRNEWRALISDTKTLSTRLKIQWFCGFALHLSDTH